MREESAHSTNNLFPISCFALISVGRPASLVRVQSGWNFYFSIYYLHFKWFIMPVLTLRQATGASLNEIRPESTTSLRVDLIVTVSICLFLTTSAVAARVFTKALDLKHVQLEDCEYSFCMPIDTVLIRLRRNPGRSGRLSYIHWHSLRGGNYGARDPSTPSRPSPHKRPRHSPCRCQSFHQALDFVTDRAALYQESQ